MKRTLPLALAVSVLLNIVLLLRQPTVAAPRPAPAPLASPSPSAVGVDADTILLREEVRELRKQLAVGKANRELERTRLFGFSTDSPGEDPETRDFQKLMELLLSFIESRETETRDGHGHPVRPVKEGLSLQNRDAALRAIEDYLGLEGPPRPSFHRAAESAIDAYHRLLEAYHRELVAAAKAAEYDDFFEDAARRRQEAQDRLDRNAEEWFRRHVQPIKATLDRRDGVRPSLLSENLSRILAQLGSPDER